MKPSFFLTAMTAVLVLLGLDAHDASAQAFGSAVAVSGDEVIAGVGGNSSTPGKIYFYKTSADGLWEESRTLSAPNASEPDGFGRAITVDGETMAVGAPLAGEVHLFQKNAEDAWVVAGSVAGEADGFGRAVALSGDVLIVGAPGGRQSTGSAYAYRKNTSGGWELCGTLLVENLAEGGQYGSVVAVNGNQVAVGEPWANNTTGAVHMFSFHAETGTWKADGPISNPGRSEGNSFGTTILIVGRHMVVGASGAENRIGAVEVYIRDEDTGAWAFDERIAPFSARGREGFGSSLAFGDGHLWVGAPGYDQRHGAIFRFLPSSETQRLGSTSLFEAVDLQPASSFGSAIAANEQVAVVGASGYDNREGAVIPFSASDDGWIQGLPLFDDSAPFASVTGGMVECDEGMAGDFPCSDVNMVSMLSIKDLGGERGISTNDIWGWEDPETGREYALVGMTNKTSFVDVSDPNNPVTMGTLEMTDGATSSLWRDMKVYKDHVYIVADAAGDHGMQVFDLRRLRDVPSPPEMFEADALYDRIASAHNVVINEETGFAYIVGAGGGGETCGGGLHMVNLENPTEPTFAGCFADTATGNSGTGYSHDAQCVVYHGPDVDYQGHEICLGSNESALSIADVTDKQNPVALSMATYPNVAYAHQGWLTEDHQYFYMNDEGDEPSGLVEGTRTLIWDVTDLDEPELAAEYIASTTETDHNLYIKGNMMYQSNYEAGFRVLDISNREAPVEVAYFDTDPTGQGWSWSNYPFFKSGVIVVTGFNTGLFVLKRKDIDI